MSELPPRPEPQLTQKLVQWRKDLLDLSKDNRSLYHRDTKTSSISITEPSYADLYDLLVVRGKQLVFPLPLDEAGTALQEAAELARLAGTCEQRVYILTNRGALAAARKDSLPPRRCMPRASTWPAPRGMRPTYCCWSTIWMCCVGFLRPHHEPHADSPRGSSCLLRIHQ